MDWLSSKISWTSYKSLRQEGLAWVLWELEHFFSGPDSDQSEATLIYMKYSKKTTWEKTDVKLISEGIIFSILNYFRRRKQESDYKIWVYIIVSLYTQCVWTTNTFQHFGWKLKSKLNKKFSILKYFLHGPFVILINITYLVMLIVSKSIKVLSFIF